MDYQGDEDALQFVHQTSSSKHTCHNLPISSSMIYASSLDSAFRVAGVDLFVGNDVLYYQCSLQRTIASHCNPP